MPIFYQMRKKRDFANNRDINCPVAKSLGTVDEYELADRISDRCSLSTSDVLAVIQNLAEVVPEILEEGKRVKLGRFGTFGIRFSTKKPTGTGIDYLIDKIAITFRPEARLKANLQEAKASKALI